MKITGTIVLAVSLLSSAGAFAQHAYQGQDQNKGFAAPSQDVQQPSAGGSGEDVCTKWNLSEADLKTCRQQWMDAKTESDRLAVRDRYGANTGLKGQVTKHEGATGPE